MPREMRRKAQAISKEVCEEILRAGQTGVLSVLGDDGYPYGVPVNYLYDRGKIWIHGAKCGHKWDAINAYEKVSFCVVAQDKVIQETFSTDFVSVILFGKAKCLTKEEEMLAAVRLFAEKYAPDMPKERQDTAVLAEIPALGMICIEIDEMTGKEALNLSQKRKEQEKA